MEKTWIVLGLLMVGIFEDLRILKTTKIKKLMTLESLSLYQKLIKKKWSLILKPLLNQKVFYTDLWLSSFEIAKKWPFILINTNVILTFKCYY